MFSAWDGAAELQPHVTEGFGNTRIILWLLVLLLFPFKSRSLYLGAAPISFHSSLGHYVWEVFKTNECRKCNLLLATKEEIMGWLLLQTKQKSQGCMKGLHFAKQQGAELAAVQWEGSLCAGEFLQLRQK